MGMFDDDEPEQGDSARPSPASPPPDTDTLSTAMLAFAAKYLELGANSHARTDAYLHAYPKCKGRKQANSEAAKLLRDPRIIEHLRTLRAQLAEKTVISLSEIEAGLARIARMDVRHAFRPGSHEIIPPSEWPDELALAVAGYSCKPGQWGDSHSIKLPDRIQALRTLAEMKGALRKVPEDDPSKRAPRATFVLDFGKAFGKRGGKQAALADRGQPLPVQGRVIEGQGVPVGGTDDEGDEA